MFGYNVLTTAISSDQFQEQLTLSISPALVVPNNGQTQFLDSTRKSRSVKVQFRPEMTTSRAVDLKVFSSPPGGGLPYETDGDARRLT